MRREPLDKRMLKRSVCSELTETLVTKAKREKRQKCLWTDERGRGR